MGVFNRFDRSEWAPRRFPKSQFLTLYFEKSRVLRYTWLKRKRDSTGLSEQMKTTKVIHKNRSQRLSGPFSRFIRRFLLLSLVLMLTAGTARAEAPRTRTSNTQEKSYAVAVHRNTVYLGKGRNVVVLDVSESASPREVGRIRLPGLVRDINVDRDRLYVAASMSGMRIINVSDPAKPGEMGSVQFEGRADGLDHRRDHVFVAARTAGLQIVDVSGPSEPEVVGSFKTEEQAADVAVSEKLAHVASTFGGHRIIDITDLTTPKEIGSAKRGSYDFGFSWGIAQDGRFVYVANVEIGIRRVNVSGVDRSSTNNKAPTQKLIQDVYRPADVTVAGDYTYLADQEGGLRIYFSKRKKKKHFFEVGGAKLAGRAMDVAVAGNRAYVAVREAGLRIVNVSDPFEPTVTGTWDSDVFAVDITASSKHIYVADRDNRLWIGDLSRPGSPERTGVYYIPGIEQVVYSDSHVFAAAGPEGVHIIDVSDPSRPEKKARLKTTHEAIGATVRNGLLVVSEKEEGVELFDVSDPGNPEKIGAWDTDASGNFYNNPAAVSNAVITDDRAYLLYNDGIRVLKLSEPGSPEMIGFLPMKQRPRRATVRGNTMYVACDDGFRVLNVRKPEDPSITGFYDTSGIVTDVDISEDTAYITEFDHGLSVLDISDHENPERIRTVSPKHHRSHALAIQKGHAYIAADRGGVHVIRLAELIGE